MYYSTKIKQKEIIEKNETYDSVFNYILSKIVDFGERPSDILRHLLLIEPHIESANRQIGKSANRQIGKSANQQISKSANQQISKSANQQISKSAKFN